MEKGDARRLVSIIRNIIAKGYDESTACDFAGVSEAEYQKALHLIESEEVLV